MRKLTLFFGLLLAVLTTAQTTVSIRNQKMEVNRNGQTYILAPNGDDASYFWASVSPDGKHLVYVTARYGTFVCDINGENVRSMGRMNAPKWLDDNHISGMQEFYKGHDEIDYNITKEDWIKATEDHIEMFPLDFEEFLWATDNHVLATKIREHYATDEAMPESVHKMALDLYQKYLVVGGMPECVKKFVETYSYIECRALQQAILNGYDADMSKYATPATAVKIRACWNSIPAQLAKENKKFQYKLAKKGGTAKIFGEAINWLILSGIVLKCRLVSHGYIPLTAYEDDSDFKIYVSDVGLLSAKAQMPVQMLLNAVDTDNTFLGSVVENYVGQALKSNGMELRYWKNDNTAELEFVIQEELDVIPVEVKKGARVKAISMNSFVQSYQSKIAYRISSKNFGVGNNIKSIPLYAVFCIDFQ